MRKFTIPKYLYALLVVMLGVLSIGYTYAYFSSTYQTSANLQLGQIGIVWRDAVVNKVINNGANSISITSEELDAGEYSKIQAPTDDQSSMRDSSLSLLNQNATVGIYCRIKLDATYIPKGESEPISCGDQWIQLAYDNGVVTRLITDSGWFYDNGYYYYGRDNGTKTLTSLNANSGIVIANRLYLIPDVDAEMYGGSVSITLTCDAVQTTNNAYQAVWGVTW